MWTVYRLGDRNSGKIYIGIIPTNRINEKWLNKKSKFEKTIIGSYDYETAEWTMRQLRIFWKGYGEVIE